MSERMSETHRMTVLCRRLKASDEAALETVFRTMRQRLMAYVRSMVGADVAAHDIIQDVFADLWEMRDTLEPSKSLEALLYRMTRNRTYTYKRDRSSRLQKQEAAAEHAKRSDIQAVHDSPDADLDAGTLKRRLEEWIAALPNRQREALTLSRTHHLTHQEIANVMDISPRTVNNHIVRALDTLHEKVDAYDSSLLQSWNR